MSKFQTFIQNLIGVKAPYTPPTSTQSGYLGFSNPYQYYQNSGSEELLKSYKSWAYAAVTKRSDEFSSMKLTLNKIVKKGKNQEIQPVTSHPVLELLDRVNPYLTFADLLKITQIYKDLAGNAYWWIIKSGTKIIEIWPYFRPDKMSVIPSATKFIDGYNYLTPKGEFVKFQPEEIIHFKTPNPLDPYLGVAPMEACYLAYNTYMQSSEFNNRFFKNNARADFILDFPNGLSEVEQKQIRAQWESRHRGESHQHKFGILSGDAKILQTGMSAKDMEFIEQMKFTRDEILAIFKVPKALLDPQELNYASAQVAKEVFLNEVIVPLMREFTQTLNEFLLPDYGDDSLFFDFENPGEENPDVKFRRYDVLSRVGAIAPNEIRANEGLAPFEGGDSIYMSAMLMPIGQADSNQGKMFLGKVEKIKMPKKYNVNIKSRSESAEIREEIIKSIEKETLGKKKQILPPEVKKKTDKEVFGEMLWNGKIVKTNEDERAMKTKVRKEFLRQEKQVLKSLEEKSFTFDFDEEEEAKIFAEIFDPFITDVVLAYGNDAMQLIDMRGFTLSTRAKDWIKANVNNFSTEINTTTKDKIRSVLANAVEQGQGIEEVQRGIRGVFAEATTSRARAIARTEITHASNYASVEAWKQSEVVESKEWFTALDERTCDECIPLHGKVIDLDGKFNNDDNIFANAGEPPAHVNCRCTLLPVIKSKSSMISELKKEKDKLEKTIEEVKEKGEREIGEIKSIKEKLNKIVIDERENG